ncbi:MAG: ABC transporter ATP-binding protein [Armatimonadota bacterium]
MKTPKPQPYSECEPLQGQIGQKEALLLLLRRLAPLRTAMAAGLVLTLIWSVVGLGYGALAKFFFDTIEEYAGKGEVGVGILNFWTLVVLPWMAFRACVYFAKAFVWTWVSQRLTLGLRNDVYAHLQRQSLSFFDKRKTGQLLSSLSNDVPQVTQVLNAIQDLVSAPFILVFGTLLLFWINVPLALVSCLVLPPIAFIIIQATRRLKTYSSQLQNAQARVVDQAEETISGVRVVKSFANEEYEIERFRHESQDVFRSVMRIMRLNSAMRPLVELLGAFAIMLVLWVGGRQIILGSGGVSLGDLFFFVMTLQQVADAARNTATISSNLTTAGVSADRIFTLLGTHIEVEEKPEAIELGDVKGRIELRNVEFAYSAGIPVLAGISFTMEPGEVVAIVGPTGAGKTTIAALIPRFYDVSGGSILVDGVDIRDCTLHSLRAQIGIVPQETVLFAGTLRDNIRYGRLEATDEEIEAAARTANAWEFISRAPEGLDTIVGERGLMLSGGQRQRIAIARAVLRDPRILILDEATSSLDSQSEALVQDALQKLVADRTTLVIAHRLSTIQNADKILVMKYGQIVEAGRHEELLARGGTYSELYRTQFRRAGAGESVPQE